MCAGGPPGDRTRTDGLVSVGNATGMSLLLRPGDFTADATLIVVHSQTTEQSGAVVQVSQQLVAKGPVRACEPVDLPR
jgi:hypothetical protein